MQNKLRKEDGTKTGPLSEDTMTAFDSIFTRMDNISA